MIKSGKWDIKISSDLTIFKKDPDHDHVFLPYFRMTRLENKVCTDKNKKLGLQVKIHSLIQKQFRYL